MKEVFGSSDYQRLLTKHLPDDDGTQRMGQCEFDDRVIFINMSEVCCSKSFLDTAIHEEVHAGYPEFDERETEQMTNALLKGLKPTQKQKYFNLYDRRTTRHYKP